MLATFLSTKNVLDIGGITTMYVITRRIQYMQFIITTLKHSWDKESNKKKVRYYCNVLPEHKVFENHRKSLIQHCERSELHLHFEWTKVCKKCQKWSILGTF